MRSTQTELMSIAESADVLNVSRRYVCTILLRKHVLGRVYVIGGKKLVTRAKVEAYRRKQRRRALRALRDLARVSQEAGLYIVKAEDE
jgi:hypothetical protein